MSSYLLVVVGTKNHHMLKTSTHLRYVKKELWEFTSNVNIIEAIDPNKWKNKEIKGKTCTPNKPINTHGVGEFPWMLGALLKSKDNSECTTI